MLDQAKARRQKVVVNHADPHAFRPTEPASYLELRDLGVAAATGGMVGAMVLRAAHPCRPGETGGAHRHMGEFQLLYVLKGWVKMNLAGRGEVVMKAGSCWTQPRGLAHDVVEYSDDYEVLLLDVPANYETSAAVLPEDRTGKERPVVSHAGPDDFKPIEKRTHLVARDLGVMEGTGGRVNAFVARAAHPFRAGQAGGRHRHGLDFQMMYVLKGHQTMDLGPLGTIKMPAGTCWTQPPDYVHEVVDYSDDFECIVIDLPAEYETVDL